MHCIHGIVYFYRRMETPATLAVFQTRFITQHDPECACRAGCIKDKFAQEIALALEMIKGHCNRGLYAEKSERLKQNCS